MRGINWGVRVEPGACVLATYAAWLGGLSWSSHVLKLLQHQESCYSSRAARMATGGLTTAPEVVAQVSSPPPIS